LNLSLTQLFSDFLYISPYFLDTIVNNPPVTISHIFHNCYPIELINRKIRDRLRAIDKNGISKNVGNRDNNFNRTLVIPFMREVSSDIKRSVKNLVDVIYTVPKKLNTIIKKGKDKLNVNQNTEVVYKINCKDCDQAYIGQTKRHIETRIKEHRSNIRNAYGNQSVVTNHRLQFNHDFEWDRPEILHKEKNRKKREIAEMFFIKKFKKSNNSINLQKDTGNLSPIYDRLIT